MWPARSFLAVAVSRFYSWLVLDLFHLHGLALNRHSHCLVKPNLSAAGGRRCRHRGVELVAYDGAVAVPEGVIATIAARESTGTKVRMPDHMSGCIDDAALGAITPPKTCSLPENPGSFKSRSQLGFNPPSTRWRA
ncbi:MAG: hypothetical protein OXU68_14675 [Bacteroidota bacterium]|nr:hypothetical protein [Bacteroidota bacterium]